MFPYKIYYINTFSSYYFYFVVERLYFVDAYHSYCSSKALALAGQGLPRSLTLIIDGDHFGWVALLAASHGHHWHQPPNTTHITQLQHYRLTISVSSSMCDMFVTLYYLTVKSWPQKAKFAIVGTNAVLRWYKRRPPMLFCNQKVWPNTMYNSCIRIGHLFL